MKKNSFTLHSFQHIKNLWEKFKSARSKSESLDINDSVYLTVMSREQMIDALIIKCEEYLEHIEELEEALNDSMEN